MTTDFIRIQGMRFWGKHGVTPAESAESQPVDLDVEISCDCSKAAKSDDLADAVDYDGIFRACEHVVTHHSFHLLEGLAEACLREIFKDRRIAHATIRVRKPRLLDGATPEVQITRTNS